MNLAVGCLFLFVGACCIAIAVHGLEASTPWQAYQTVLSMLRGEADLG